MNFENRKSIIIELECYFPVHSNNIRGCVENNNDGRIEQPQRDCAIQFNERSDGSHTEQSQTQNEHLMQINESHAGTHIERSKRNYFKIFFFAALITILLLVIYITYENLTAKSVSETLSGDVQTTTEFSPSSTSTTTIVDSETTTQSISNPISTPSTDDK